MASFPLLTKPWVNQEVRNLMVVPFKSLMGTQANANRYGPRSSALPNRSLGLHFFVLFFTFLHYFFQDIHVVFLGDSTQRRQLGLGYQLQQLWIKISPSTLEGKDIFF